MEDFFGTHLVKFKKQEEAPNQEEPADEQKEEGEQAEEKPQSLGQYCEQVPLDQVFNKADDSPLRYIGVVFSAEYCPPC